MSYPRLHLPISQSYGLDNSSATCSAVNPLPVGMFSVLSLHLSRFTLHQVLEFVLNFTRSFNKLLLHVAGEGLVEEGDVFLDRHQAHQEGGPRPCLGEDQNLGNCSREESRSYELTNDGMTYIDYYSQTS